MKRYWAHEMPRISIITLSKNCIDDLIATRNSVVPILSSDVEHIIIDGASNDGTLAYLKNIDSEPYTRCLSEPDCGISDAFNKGVALAKGEWLLFLNSGDLLINQGWASIIKKILRRDLSVNIVAALACYGKSTIPKRRHYNFEPLFTKSLISHQATFVRRPIFDKYGSFDLSLKIRMDYDFWVRVLKKERFEFVNSKLVEYKVGGISSRMARKFIEEEKLIHNKHLGRMAWIANIRANLKMLIKPIKASDVV